MFALIGNFDLAELGVVLLAAILFFGRRLPEVAMRTAAHVARLRRQLLKMWREAGLEDELRRVRDEVERDMPDPRLHIDPIGDLRRTIEPRAAVTPPRAADMRREAEERKRQAALARAEEQPQEVDLDATVALPRSQAPAEPEADHGATARLERETPDSPAPGASGASGSPAAPKSPAAPAPPRPPTPGAPVGDADEDRAEEH